MGWKQEQQQRDEEIVAELRRIHAAIDDLTPAVGPYEPPTTVRLDFRRFPGLATCVRLCREDGEPLLGMLKPVPREHREGPHGLIVNCLCGKQTRVVDRLKPCGGADAHEDPLTGYCGRWFVGDESGVWSVMLPRELQARAAA